MGQALHSVSVTGVIIDDQRRALIIRRRDNGHWEPPGGVLELDESIPDGVRRELREETGLEVDVHELTGIYKNMTRGIVALVFRCSAVSGELRHNPEVTEFRWVSEHEAPDLLDEAYAARVLDAFADGSTRVRAHDGTRILASAD